jgi:hypothetical protein
MATETEEIVESPLQGLLKRRKELHESVVPLIEARREIRTSFDARKADEDETKRPTAEERSTFIADEEQFNEQVAEKLSEIKQLDVRIEQEEAAERSLEIAQRASRPESITITHQPLTYREDNQRDRSYFLDLAAMQIPEVRQRASGRIEGYAERLEGHAKEMGSIMPERFAAAERRAQAETDKAEIEFRKRIGHRGGFDESPFTRNAALESRAPTRITGQGGYAIERVALAA